MKSILLSVILSISISPIFGQCFFGFELINNNSAVVIKKHGFPINTEFRFKQITYFFNDTIVTTGTSHANDTLSFDSQADSLTAF